MVEARHERRAFLTAAAAVGGGLATVGRASATDTEDLENACSRRDEGQEEQTLPINPVGPNGTIDVTVADSGVSGPTACIIGGIHGDEEAGISAAHNIMDWSPDAGMLVVLPEANPVAIENHTRAGEHGDLNRKFVHGQPPTSELAQSLWQAVTAADPDLLITLQESRGIYGSSSGGVGQAIFDHKERIPTMLPVWDGRWSTGRLAAGSSNSASDVSAVHSLHRTGSSPRKLPTTLVFRPSSSRHTKKFIRKRGFAGRNKPSLEY